ncbi:PREDICTED: nuclear speckle RNA-binding protein B [Tarenaya hassleriana]|uniref:nuclear speckle RNA-binding protein B n=1 Tax=Tarenaya hassleriana TaxID=28532 RepID=UPI00053C49C6|nr:PREDICTED: nuclear speckle RNA-binding protein B [Tarenaya hassleriana]
MDPSENSQANRSPRSREILGPRPAPLRVRKDSHKIKKPPLAPPQQHHPHQEAPPLPAPPPPRAPVIIYTVSPKIIHTNPSDFMTLVQRLTGKTASSSSSSGFATAVRGDGSISPAARYAATEKANNISSSSSSSPPIKNQSNSELGFAGGSRQEQQFPAIERPSFFPGILSPGPTSLPPISPNFFSPVTTIDPLTGLPFFNDISSIIHQPSPSIPSPYSLDLFNNLFGSQ